MPTLQTVEPWQLKLIDNYKGIVRRYWVGGYWDNGDWVFPAVTVEQQMGENWIQIEQYDTRVKTPEVP